MAYWLGFGGFTADALHSIPGQGTIPHAAQYRQNAKKQNRVEASRGVGVVQMRDSCGVDSVGQQSGRQVGRFGIF